MSKLAENITTLLKARGWTQAQLADKADVEPATISRVMRGSSFLVSDSLVKMAKALGVTTSDLITENTSIRLLDFTTQRRIPVWTFAEAVSFVYSSPLYDRNSLPKDQRFVLTERDYDEMCFALLVTDGAMSPAVPIGAVVIIDPRAKESPGKIVAVGYMDGGYVGITLRHYHDRGFDDCDSEVFEAVPIQPAFRTFHSEHDIVKVLGVVVERRLYEEHHE